MLQGEKIYKAFGQKTVLANVNIIVEKGEALVLTGPSGGGKTTLLRCLSLLEAPDSGSVEIDGTIYKFSQGTGATKGFPYPYLTIVFQQLFLWPHLTNRDNILLSLQKFGKHEQEYLNHLINHFEMKDFIDNYPNQSSLGQKQRVALTRALILDPKYILLDEATSALDDNRVGRVIEELIALKKKGVGILLITHSLDLAKQVGDRFYKLEKSSLREAI
jgi:polar amino acid transport system ATP-binding protein